MEEFVSIKLSSTQNINLYNSRYRRYHLSQFYCLFLILLAHPNLQVILGLGFALPLRRSYPKSSSGRATVPHFHRTSLTPKKVYTTINMIRGHHLSSSMSIRHNFVSIKFRPGCLNHIKRKNLTKLCSQPDDFQLDESEISKSNSGFTSSIWRTMNTADWGNPNPSNSSITETTSEPASSYLATYSDLKPITATSNTVTSFSPIEKLMIQNKFLYLKRDDLLHLPHSYISGNKARKMQSLNQISLTDFPKVIVSYGGPQSNSMLALAAVVHSKNRLYQEEQKSKHLSMDETPFQFVYVTKKLPRWLRNTPSGNFLRAKSLGMKLVEVPPKEYNDLFAHVEDLDENKSNENSIFGASITPPPQIAEFVTSQSTTPVHPGDALWVPQGGATGMAIPGVAQLAHEIYSFWKSQTKSDPTRKLAVCIPGGTCTTALFLQRSLNRIISKKENKESCMDIQVIAIPCVGDAKYAKHQMSCLDKATGGDGVTDLPDVITPVPSHLISRRSKKVAEKKYYYYSFGNPHADIMTTFQTMQKYNVNLDLLYGASAWTLLLQHWKYLSAQSILTFSTNDEKEQKLKFRSPLEGREVMYVHSGGLEGNASQMTRYKQKGLIVME